MASRTSRNHRTAVADALHSAAIHLLRGVRKEDERTGVGPARLSALSVLVFAGPMRLTELAGIEQVKPPTMTKVIAGLEAGGLVRRRADAQDARAVRLEATRAERSCYRKADGAGLSVSLLRFRRSLRRKSTSSPVPPLLSSACRQRFEIRKNRPRG